MRYGVTLSSIVLLGLADCLGAQAPSDLTKVTELGPLGEYFDLLDTGRQPSSPTSGSVVLKLKARMDVDPSTISFRVGFFDKDDYLCSASRLQFLAEFPLKKGESVSAQGVYSVKDWQRIVIRKSESFADAKAKAPKGSITIAFTATVANVDDRHGLFDGSIKVGGKLTGSYTFDPLAMDSSVDPTVGDYQHKAAGYGIQVKVGNYVFKTDPSKVDFLLEVVSRPKSHSYLLRSYNNLVVGPRLSEVCADHISWQLDDSKGMALAGEKLPLDPPNLPAWKSDFGLTITGGVSRDKGFLVRAHVDEIRKLP